VDVSKLLPVKKVISLRTIHDLNETLMSSSYGFPKIHRVWHYVLRELFGEDPEGCLGGGSTRRRSLSEKKHQLLSKISDVLVALLRPHMRRR
jgi:hypothetical protein